MTRKLQCNHDGSALAVPVCVLRRGRPANRMCNSRHGKDVAITTTMNCRKVLGISANTIVLRTLRHDVCSTCLCSLFLVNHGIEQGSKILTVLLMHVESN
jgi:hypothetical protein